MIKYVWHLIQEMVAFGKWAAQSTYIIFQEKKKKISKNLPKIHFPFINLIASAKKALIIYIIQLHIIHVV